MGAALGGPVTQVVVRLRWTSLVNSPAPDNFLKKPEHAFQALAGSCSSPFHSLPLPASHLPWPSSPCAVLPWAHAPSFGAPEFVFIWKRRKSICSSLKKVSRKSCLMDFYACQVQTRFQILFELLKFNLRAEFESCWHIHVNSCLIDTDYCLLNTFAAKIYNRVWSS